MKVPITVSYGDGIGPEIMEACVEILQAAGAELDIDVIEIGEKVFLSGNTTGINPNAWTSLRRTGVFYKAPITTPQGGGYKSINVTMRKTLGLYANVRPVVSYYPYVDTKHPQMDMVIIRENEEDLYAGIEHRQTPEVYQCLKLISRPASERINRYAFEYARVHGRRKVTCFTKDNIMKMTDGLFHKTFDEVARDYPELEHEHMIIDIGTAKTATEPEKFDVIVMPNLYGDVVSDVVAQLTGSVGLAGSANIGDSVAMFEAIHGSAPDIAGKGIANPSGLLLAGVMLLVHIGQPAVAERVHNAWLRTIEDGIHTGDIYKQDVSKERVGTKGFTQAVIQRLGEQPQHMRVVKYEAGDGMPPIKPVTRPRPASKELIGVDVFLDWDAAGRDPNVLGAELSKVNTTMLRLEMITNRGLKVWPGGLPETFCVDHWRCRFESPDQTPITHTEVLELLARISIYGYDFIKTEHLYKFDGEIAFSLGQGQ